MSDPNKNDNVMFELRVDELFVIIAIIIGIIVVVGMYDNDNQEEQTQMETTMIEGKCFTYLDEFKKIPWPTNFCIEPKVGQRVESLSTPVCSLRIQQITHCERPSALNLGNEPYLKIELR